MLREVNNLWSRAFINFELAVAMRWPNLHHGGAHMCGQWRCTDYWAMVMSFEDEHDAAHRPAWLHKCTTLQHFHRCVIAATFNEDATPDLYFDRAIGISQCPEKQHGHDECAVLVQRLHMVKGWATNLRTCLVNLMITVMVNDVFCVAECWSWVSMTCVIPSPYA